MSKKKLVYVGQVSDIRVEDGGQAKIASIYDNSDSEDAGIFFRFQSWAEGGGVNDHPILDGLVKAGTKVRITLEVL